MLKTSDNNAYLAQKFLTIIFLHYGKRNFLDPNSFPLHYNELQIFLTLAEIANNFYDMTKYFLHGGEAGRHTPDNKKFFSEMANGLSGTINVLSILFARDKAIWNEKFEEDKINFSFASPQKVFSFVLATDKISAFIEQIKQADIIYLKGGDTHVLQKYLVEVPDLENLFTGKVVSGVSAGALVLSKYYDNDEGDKFYEGLGILPIKTFCHYTDEKSDKLMKLKEFGENIESVYAIPEEKFFIIEC